MAEHRGRSCATWEEGNVFQETKGCLLVGEQQGMRSQALAGTLETEGPMPQDCWVINKQINFISLGFLFFKRANGSPDRLMSICPRQSLLQGVFPRWKCSVGRKKMVFFCSFFFLSDTLECPKTKLSTD